MINVPSLKIRQFGVEFYQTTFTSGDIQRLVKFEVLNYPTAEEEKKGIKKSKTSAINWELLEKRIGRSEAAFQRPMIRKKIRELIQYYSDCQEAQNLPAIPGAVILITERRSSFLLWERIRMWGCFKFLKNQGYLRCLDGQHRLLALNAPFGEECGD